MKKLFDRFFGAADESKREIIDHQIQKEPEISQPVTAILALIESDPDRFEIKQDLCGYHSEYHVTDTVTGVGFIVDLRLCPPDSAKYLSYTSWLNGDEAKELYLACNLVLKNRSRKRKAILNLEADDQRRKICELYGAS